MFCLGILTKKKRCYTIKNGYKVSLSDKFKEGCSNSSSDQNWWTRMWNLNIPPKVKIFIWRLCNKAIPSLSNLFCRKVVADCYCQRCGLDFETDGHAVWWCKEALEVWYKTPFWCLISSFSGLPCYDVVRGLAALLDGNALVAVCMTLWGIWLSRNSFIHLVLRSQLKI
ncbi:hypothetical protein ACOSQ3_010566 [Xanthoceras sorbifolium]